MPLIILNFLKANLIPVALIFLLISGYAYAFHSGYKKSDNACKAEKTKALKAAFEQSARANVKAKMAENLFALERDKNTELSEQLEIARENDKAAYACRVPADAKRLLNQARIRTVSADNSK